MVGQGIIRFLLPGLGLLIDMGSPITNANALVRLCRRNGGGAGQTGALLPSVNSGGVTRAEVYGMGGRTFMQPGLESAKCRALDRPWMSCKLRVNIACAMHFHELFYTNSVVLCARGCIRSETRMACIRTVCFAHARNIAGLACGFDLATDFVVQLRGRTNTRMRLPDIFRRTCYLDTVAEYLRVREVMLFLCV